MQNELSFFNTGPRVTAYGTPFILRQGYPERASENISNIPPRVLERWEDLCFE